MNRWAKIFNVRIRNVIKAVIRFYRIVFCWRSSLVLIRNVKVIAWKTEIRATCIKNEIGVRRLPLGHAVGGAIKGFATDCCLALRSLHLMTILLAVACSLACLSRLTCWLSCLRKLSLCVITSSAFVLKYGICLEQADGCSISQSSRSDCVTWPPRSPKSPPACLASQAHPAPHIAKRSLGTWLADITTVDSF